MPLIVALALPASNAWAASFNFSSDADWNTGVLTSTTTNPPPNTGNGHVRLPDTILTPFEHIWVALSGRGTVARIDTTVDPTTIGNNDSFLTTAEAGGVAVLGEFRTAPQGQPANPSRTTVDANGDVWVGNRDQGGGLGGSAAKISANPTGTTSNGLFGSGDNGGAAGTFNALPWNNAGGVDTDGGVDTASDSANLLYIRTTDINNVRALAVDANNDVWIGGNNNFSGAARPHQLFDGTTGAPVPSGPLPETSFNTSVSTDNANNGVGGGYGMLIDGNGVVWAATLEPAVLVRHDPATGDTRRIGGFNRYTYGLGIDNNGKLWVSNWDGNTVQRVDTATGAIEATFAPGAFGLRGVAVTGDNDIWIAASHSNGVVRLNNDGTVQTFIPTGLHPTGVAVDSNGKVWVTNLNSSTVSRIDPAAGANGAVDLTIDMGPGASPYNYSDMTGTVLVGSTNPSGTWRRVMDGGAGAFWNDLFFNLETEGVVPPTTDLTIEARVSDDLLNWTAYVDYTSGDLIGLTGRYLEVRATLARTGGSQSTPVLSDLRVNFTPSNVVPEPTSLALAGLALAALARTRRRRRS